MISIVGTSCKRRPRSRERTTDPEPATPPLDPRIMKSPKFTMYN